MKTKLELIAQLLKIAHTAEEVALLKMLRDLIQFERRLV